MQFELTKVLADGILFSMEDQKGKFYVDTQEGIIIGGPEDAEETDSPDMAEEGRFIPLPTWDSAGGYRLMERFATALKNPVIRDELTSALDRGRGVFRAFKDVLTPHPEVEQLWFSFKQREMRRVILNWYNALRAEWGLEQVGREPEETGDLVLEDFRFREPEAEDMPLVQKLHQLCVDEYRKYAEAQGLGNLFAVFPGNIIEEESLRGRPFLIAETVGGDFAAHVSVIQKDKVLYISSLEVRPEYRGLGIGEALLSRLAADLDRDSISDIFLDLPAGVEGFSRVLFRSAFKPYATRYCLSLKKEGS